MKKYEMMLDEIKGNTEYYKRKLDKLNKIKRDLKIAGIDGYSSIISNELDKVIVGLEHKVEAHNEILARAEMITEMVDK